MEIDTLAHKATAVATFVILVKFYMTTTIQGGARFRGGSRPPEDAVKLKRLAKALGSGSVQQLFGLQAIAASAAADGQAPNDEKLAKAKLRDARWQRIVLNDLENIPISLIIAWTSLLSAYSPKLHAVLVAGMAVARVGHTISYAKELQPHRAIFWGSNIAFTLVMAGNGLVGLFLK